MTTRPGKPVQRQATLPLSKAIEIAWKNIRMRLSRSLVVTSGIVLALAFLMAILTSDAMIDSMRRWAHGTAERSSHFADLRAQRDQLFQQVHALEVEIRSDVRDAGAAPHDATSYDPVQSLGEDFASIQERLGPLPVSESELLLAASGSSSVARKFEQWVRASTQLKSINDELTAPQQLQAMLKANGVPTTPDEIASARIQNRWLLGLALLVAFVGILNAMLMSVTERFREIGTMKCLGALDSFIVKLFLLESLFQGIVGTILGAALGLGLSLLALTATYGRFAWMQVPATQLLLGVALCLIVGVGLTVAGAVYPAWQAARMQPIEAMRVDT